MIDPKDLSANYHRRRKPPEFNFERFTAACRYNLLVDKKGNICSHRLHAQLKEWMMDEGFTPATLRSVQRVLNGDTDPLHGAAGRRPLIFSLAPALGFTVDWLTSSGRRRRS